MIRRFNFSATRGDFTFASHVDDGPFPRDRLIINYKGELLVRKYDDFPATMDMSVVGRPMEIVKWAQGLSDDEIDQLRQEYLELNPKWENASISGSFISDVIRTSKLVDVTVFSSSPVKLFSKDMKKSATVCNHTEATTVIQILNNLYGIELADGWCTRHPLDVHPGMQSVYRVKHVGWQRGPHPVLSDVITLFKNESEFE